MIKIADIMTTNPYTATHTDTLSQALTICNEHKIRHLPVLDEQQHLVGIVSERDLLSAQESSLSTLSLNQRDNIEQHVQLKDIMSRKLHTVSPKASVEEAARHIEQHRIGCLPAVQGEKLVGIITDSDFVGVAITLLEMLAEQDPVESDF